MTRTPTDDLLHYLNGSASEPHFLHGNALGLLREFPGSCIDCCLTSPPYWRQRRYEEPGLGHEADPAGYVGALCEILREVHRVLKPTGSLWLNIGDTYHKKRLLGIPWRVALRLTDEQGWILRNSIIWNKVKGSPDQARDKLRNVHENVFHLVKQASGYFYDVDAIRSPAGSSKVVNGAIVSATGVTGVRYRRQIELSTALSETERRVALEALQETLGEVRAGKLSDFRMVIRRQQRTTHSDSPSISGRARELEERGFYFLRYHPRGSKPGDVWDILPEDSQKRERHFAPYPADLCRIPIQVSCPERGVVLDPFCGTGTTMLVAREYGRRSVGIDLSEEYLQIARSRCQGGS